MYSSYYKTRVIKEWRVIIRVIQFIFSILAFATTLGFETTTSFTTTCKPPKPQNVTNVTISYSVEYPFKLDDQKIGFRVTCFNETLGNDTFQIDFSSSAQFYVATGVLSFVYTVASLVLYVLVTTYYKTNPLISVIDLGATVVLTIFWLSGEWAWVVGVSDVKRYTKPEHIMSEFNFCRMRNESQCTPDSHGHWSSLNISLIFGLANVFLWGASLWYVYKETAFHRKPTLNHISTPGRQTAGFGEYEEHSFG